MVQMTLSEAVEYLDREATKARAEYQATASLLAFFGRVVQDIDLDLADRLASATDLLAPELRDTLAVRTLLSVLRPTHEEPDAQLPERRLRLVLSTDPEDEPQQ